MNSNTEKVYWLVKICLSLAVCSLTNFYIIDVDVFYKLERSFFFLIICQISYLQLPSSPQTLDLASF